MKKFLSVICTALILTSCTNTLSYNEYIKFIDNVENGFTQVKDIQNYEFKLKYKPTEYVSLQECVSKSIPFAEIHKISVDFDKLLHFNFSIKDEILNSEIVNKEMGYSDFNDKFFYYTFDVQNDFYLINGSDTLPCVISHMERTYQITNATTFVLAFEKPSEINNDLIFCYDDHILDCGLIRFKLTENAIKNSPKLKI